MKVRDADGVGWTVRRRWLPWTRRTKGLMDYVPAPGGSSGDVPDDPILLALWLVFVFPIVIVGGLLIAVIGLELAVLVLLLPVVVFARALFGGWPIVVRRAGTVVGSEKVGGWRASRARIRAIGAEIASRPPTRLVDTSGDPYQYGVDFQA